MCASTGRSTAPRRARAGRRRAARATASPTIRTYRSKPTRGDVPGLLAAQEVARAADLQVLHRDRHARAHLGVLGDGGQPLVGGLGQRPLRRVQEVGVAALAAAADPAAQLVQLRAGRGVGAVDDQGVGVRDVQAGLDDGRRDQDVELPLPEPAITFSSVCSFIWPCATPMRASGTSSAQPWPRPC